MKQDTLIIGAGLAGLAAGYTLTKAGHKVTILEKESYPGGRVRSLPIDSSFVDFGGFIIYPWYKEYHRLINELDLKDQLRDIPLSSVYYELQTGEYTKDNDMSFPLSQMAKLYAKTLPKMIRYQMDIAQPELHIFNDASISTYIREALETDSTTTYETFSDVVCQGYCYGPVTEYKMAVVAPVVLNTTFRGNLKDSVFFNGNNGLFAHALANYISTHEGEIIYNTEVTSIQPQTVTTSTQRYTADTVICAARINETLLSEIAPHIPVACPYTRFYNIVVELDSVPKAPNGAVDWGAVFYLPDTSMPYQVLSSVNIHEMIGPQIDGRYINLNVIDRTNNETLSKEQLLNELTHNLQSIFPNTRPVKIIESIHWQETMPIAEESFIESIREIQGKNNIWFAGDYLGSPSMETALQTGIVAAKAILKNT